MSESQQASPGAETPDSNPEDDPEIQALLDFEAVPRKRNVDGGWTPELQREFIVRLAMHGSPGRACDEMGKNLTGMTKLYRSPHGASFRASWDAAIEIAKRREAEGAVLEFVKPGSKPPTIDHRRKWRVPEAGPQAGQVMNEYGEWEDEDSLQRRGEEALDSIRDKLLRCRRAYLAQISASAAKRAAFEILTELPVDWDKAAKLEAQPDEPWNRANMRQPDMVLTAESGWMLGEHGYGPDRKAEARKAIDEYRAEDGLPPIEWDE